MDKKTKEKKPKNRLHKGSKVSEYKTEKIIRCFADDLTAKETAEKTKISVRSIRPTYWTLRMRLFRAAQENSSAFGYAGMFLNVLNKDDLELLRKSEVFKSRMKTHFPRAAKPDELVAGDMDSIEATLLLMELIIRDCSQSEFVKDDDFDRRIVLMHKYVERTGLGGFLDWQVDQDLDAIKQRDEVIGNAIGLYEQMASTVGEMIRMEFDTLIGQARKRPYSGDVIFRDLKKYILKHPL